MDPVIKSWEIPCLNGLDAWNEKQAEIVSLKNVLKNGLRHHKMCGGNCLIAPRKLCEFQHILT